MPQIFGHEIKGKTLWIVLGVIAAGVAVVVYVRSRAAAGSSAGAAPEAGPDTSNMGGGGGGIAVPAPTQQAADNYQAALQQQQLAAGQFNLDYQKQLAGQREQQFNLEQQQQGIQYGYENQLAGAQVGLITQGINNLEKVARTGQLPSGKGVIPMSCPHGDVVQDPFTGLPTCRVPEGGGFKPLQEIGAVIQQFLQGAATGARGVGQAYVGQFAPQSVLAGQGQQQRRKLPAVATSAGPSGDQSSLAGAPGGYNQPGYHQVGGGYGVALPVSMMTAGHNG